MRTDTRFIVRRFYEAVWQWRKGGTGTDARLLSPRRPSSLAGASCRSRCAAMRSKLESERGGMHARVEVPETTMWRISIRCNDCEKVRAPGRSVAHRREAADPPAVFGYQCARRRGARRGRRGNDPRGARLDVTRGYELLKRLHRRWCAIGSSKALSIQEECDINRKELLPVENCGNSIAHVKRTRKRVLRDVLSIDRLMRKRSRARSRNRKPRAAARAVSSWLGNIESEVRQATRWAGLNENVERDVES